MPQIRDHIHVSAVSFEARIEAVWQWLTDPLRFAHIYPSWTTSVELRDDGSYAAVGPADDSFRIMPHINREHGVIDFQVVDADGNVEFSRSRLLATKDGGCTLIHFAVRWDGVDDRGWEQHKRDTDSDLQHVKQIIERSL